MRLNTLLLFALFGGVFGHICDDTIIKACPKLYENPLAFPGTAKDLEAVCPELLSHIECLENYVDECGGDIHYNPGNLPKIKRYITDVCEEDSTIRDDIVKELPCMKNTLDKMNGTCHDLSKDALDNYVEANVLDYDHPDYRKQTKRYFCFYVTSQLACLTAQVTDKCGSRARDIVLDAHFRSGYLDDDCRKDDHDEFLKFVAVLEIDLAQKTRIGRILREYHGIGTQGRR